MRLLAGEGDLKPVQPLAMGDDSDINILVLEDRPLLDMKLKEGRQLARADLFIADPADPLKLASDGLAGSVCAAIGPVQRMYAGEHA